MIKHLVIIGAAAASVLVGGCSQQAAKPIVDPAQTQVAPAQTVNAPPRAARPAPASSFPLQQNAPGGAWATTPTVNSNLGSPGYGR